MHSILVLLYYLDWQLAQLEIIFDVSIFDIMVRLPTLFSIMVELVLSIMVVFIVDSRVAWVLVLAA